MRIKSILADVIAKKSNQNTNVAIGVIAGLAIGAAFSLLFTPFSGKSLRKTIAERLLKDGQPEETVQEPQAATAAKQKKPKSDIKELVHQAHVG